MRFLPLFLLASCAVTHTACAPTTQELHYVTPCGLHMRGLADGGVPADWDEEHVATLEFLSIKHKLVTCEQIRGHSIDLHPAAWDLYNDKRMRAGSTYCNILDPRIEIALPYPSTVAHELHHVAQNCDSPPPLDPDTDADHSDWYRSGAYQAIEAVKREYEVLYPRDGGTR